MGEINTVDDLDYVKVRKYNGYKNKRVKKNCQCIH